MSLSVKIMQVGIIASRIAGDNVEDEVSLNLEE